LVVTFGAAAAVLGTGTLPAGPQPMTTKQILIPVGDGVLAVAVSRQVEPLLRCKGAEASFFQVFPPGEEAEPERSSDDLERLTTGLREAGQEVSVSSAQAEDVAAAILDRARELNPWLVVMATRGREDSVVSPASVTARVLRRSMVPLLLFNPWSLQSHFKRVVVPLDGSKAALRILPRVEELAQIFGADVVLVTVVNPSADPQAYREASHSLDGPLTELAMAGVEARARVIPGWDVARAILQAAHEHEADVVAMTTHGETAFAAWPFGSVAEKVFAQTTVPLLIKRVVELRSPAELLPPSQESQEGQEEPQAEEEEEDLPPPILVLAPFPKRLLVPLDGSDLARRVLLLLPVLLHGQEAEVTLLGVATALTPASRERLEAVAGGVRWRGLRAEVQVEVGDPATEILAAAEDSDLVLMSSHGRSGLTRWLRGSVAERVLRSTETPLLIASSASLAELTGPHEVFRRILVPHDGSRRARRILPLVAAIALVHGADVVLFRALERDEDEPLAVLAKVRGRLEAELIPDLLALRGLGVVAEIESGVGEATEEILAAAGSADLVALVSHGRGGPQRWLLGSVAEAILRRCSRPLLVVR
jgi:nucleotide-binding universal stress UspA family protein